jgi:glutamate-1-semialdehyde 2,1-aminomutase
MIRKIGLAALVCASFTPATAQADTFKTVPTIGLTWTKHGLDAGAYARLAQTTDALADGLRAAAGDRPVQVQSACGLVTVFFTDAPVRDYAGAQACDAEAYGAWCRALLAHGVYPPPSQFEAWFPSLAHGDEHIERTITAARAAFADL